MDERGGVKERGADGKKRRGWKRARGVRDKKARGR